MPYRAASRGCHDGTMTSRVFLLDDHEIVRRGLAELIDSADDLQVVGEAGTAREALEGLAATPADVAILDVQLPDGNGVEVCREVRSMYPETRCLMLTSFADDEAMFDAAVAGASGYVLKQVRGADIVGAIRRVVRGEQLIEPEMLERALERLRRGPEEDPRLAGLTPQETRILNLLADGLTNRQIAEEMFLAEKTVKNYVSNLLSKLGMSRRTEAAVFAVKMQNQRL